uniref:Uncharacterized protein n=1 Tax=Sus scrofa TaxID=9823 RepID=A0A8D0WRT6_PIG
MVNGILSLISLSDLYLLVYRNARYFHVLILYSGTLPNSLISSSSLLGSILGFSMYSFMSSANSDSFSSPFSVWSPFISFFFSLIAVARISKTMVGKSGENRHPCLIFDIRENVFHFSLLSMLAMRLSYMVFIMLRCVPSLSFF